MLTVKNVTKKYGKVAANNDVSMTLNDGEIGILLGPNGAGKSTLIKSAVGLLKYEGDIEVCGLPNRSIEAKRKLGYIPEIPALYDLLTVQEHLEFIRRAYKLENWEERADMLLERFEMLENKKKLAKELSKGMQQKLSICCALLPDPEVVIFDEPMVGLDPHAIKVLKEIFYELKAQKKTVIISTHMIDTIADVWDTVYIMQAGRVVAEKHRNNSDGESLEDIFFRITEGSEA